MEKFPKKFKGLVLHSPNDLRYEDITSDLENIDENYVVIQVSTAGIGPYDTGHIIGRLKPIEPMNYPINLGVEGCGTIIKIGSKCDSKLLGKRVSFLADHKDPKTIRAYSEFAVVKQDNVMILNDKMNDSQGAYIMTTPLTAICLFNSTILGHKAIIQDTASSSVGKTIINLCTKNNIKIISIVRKKEQIDSLLKFGSTAVLDSTDVNFYKDLENAISLYNPYLYITYQGGNLPSRIFDKMPPKSSMCSCGNINNEKLWGYSSTDFIFKGKTIFGFQIWNYLAQIGNEEKLKIYNEINESFEKGEDTYLVKITKEFDMDKYKEAIEDYEKAMSSGKIILKIKQSN